MKLRFMGAETTIALSHALFSSFDIDSGSRLLLKALASKGDPGTARTALDSGCGTGVLGIALAAAVPGLRVSAVDRDALAVAFTAMNAEANGLSSRVTATGGFLSDPRGERFDLIVSNLPAKAGEDALRGFIEATPSRLEPGGKAAVVIVRTLAGFARDAIRDAGLALLHEEEGPGHFVFMFAPDPGAPEPAALKADDDGDGLGPYGRGSFSFKLRGAEYSLRAVRGLPDFDSPGHGIELAARVLESLPRSGEGGALVMNPGQGHLSAYLALALGYGRQTLAGRDLLGLRASRRAFRAVSPGKDAETIHVALPGGLIGHVSSDKRPELIVAFPEDAPGYPWCETAAAAAARILAPEGRFLVCARSSLLADLGKKRPAGMRSVADKKENGFRALAWALN